MSTQTLITFYRDTASEFARRILQRYRDEIHSIVLYGSVARGAAGEDSDVDILVLRKNGHPDRDELIEVGDAIDFENKYRTFVSAKTMSAERLVELARGRFPIAGHVLEEGEILYDDGTFERIRQNPSGES